MRDEPLVESAGGLGLWDAVSIIVGIVIGTSIFQVPWLIFGSVTDPWMGLAVWGLGGALALVGALCYAELATTYPKAGGDYFYLTRAYGPWVGFLFGWAQLVVVFAASIGAMAFVFGENATALKNFNEIVDLAKINEDYQLGLSSEFVYAAIAVLLLSLLNIVGVVFGKWTQNILTIAKILGLLAILVAGFGWAQSSPMEWRLGKEVVNDAGQTIRTIGWSSLAIILVLYAYGGWNDAAFVAAEVRDPRRNIPLALIIGVGMITMIYLAVNLAYLMGLGFEGASKMPNFDPAAAGTYDSLSVPGRVVERAFEGWGGKAMTVIVMVSALGAVNGLIFTGARVYATLGNDYSLFGWLGQWQPGRRAPILSLLVQAVVTVGIIFALGTEKGHQFINQMLGYIGVQPEGPWRAGSAFETLVSHTAPVFWIFFMLTGFSLLLLRARDAQMPRAFAVPLYPWLPIIFCSTCAYMLYQATIYVGWRALFAIGLMLIGIPLYWLAVLFGGYKGDSR